MCDSHVATNVNVPELALLIHPHCHLGTCPSATEDRYSLCSVTMDHATQPFEGSNSFGDKHNKTGGKRALSAAIEMVECDRQAWLCNQSAHALHARPCSAFQSPMPGWKKTTEGSCSDVVNYLGEMCNKIIINVSLTP